jgi:hypothetical protein
VVGEPAWLVHRKSGRTPDFNPIRSGSTCKSNEEKIMKAVQLNGLQGFGSLHVLEVARPTRGARKAFEALSDRRTIGKVALIP